MDFLKSVFSHPAFFGFAGGFMVGLVFYVMALFGHWKTRRELKRFQRHLTDKLHLDAEQLGGLKKETEDLKKENENLRMKIHAGLAKDAAQTLKRELEIFARAEKSMLISAPGFAPAWEMAKETALREIETEEQGKKSPRSLFRKFMGGGVDSDKLLTAKVVDEPAPAGAQPGAEGEFGQPDESGESDESSGPADASGPKRPATAS